MSKKNRDKAGRWRALTIGFRVSNEENEAINRMVSLSGMTKQEYCISRLLNKEIIVYRNPRAYKGLKDQMEKIYMELARITAAGNVSTDLCEAMNDVVHVYNMTKEGEV